MRNLIIKRRSSPAGQGTALNIYGTAANEDATNEACYILGSISNGETAVIPIGDEPIKIYIAEDISTSLQHCEYCQIPAGSNDLFVSGKCIHTPKNGTAFQFDKNNDTSSGKKHVVGIVIAAALLVSAIIAAPFVMKAFSKADTPSSCESKVFSEDGIQLTLTDRFSKQDDAEGFDASFIAKDASVRIKKEPFANNDSLSAFEFAQYYIFNELQLDGAPYQEHGLTLYEYTKVNPYDGREYTYLMVFKKGPDAFWIVEFSTFTENAEAMRDLFLDYADSICFPENTI